VRDLDVQLWIVGERLPSDHAGNVSAALEAARGPRLHLLGPRDDVPQLLRAADIFTLPSHREGMPRSIIEAMMTGLPVVATDIRGSREEVIDGETGLLASEGNADAFAAALGHLLDDPKRVVKMRKTALETISKHHNLMHAANQLNRILRDAAGAAANTRAR